MKIKKTTIKLIGFQNDYFSDDPILKKYKVKILNFYSFFYLIISTSIVFFRKLIKNRKVIDAAHLLG